MSPALTVLCLVLLTALAFAVGAALVIGLAVSAGSAPLSRVRAPERAALLGWLAAAPLLVGVAGALACLLPSLLALATGQPDHCDHHDGHPHLCVVHLPEHGSGAALAIVALAATWILVSLGRELRALAHGLGLGRALLEGARADAGVHLVPSDVPFAGAIGLFRPAIVWTEGLRARLSSDQRRAVLAHERAHVVRKDALRLTAVRLGWSALPERVRQPLVDELALACEEICDRAAAEAVGDPLIVADAIVAARRAGPSFGPAFALPGMPAVGFGAHAAERRVARLLDPADRAAPIRPRALLLAAALLLALAEPLHHLTETALGLVLG